MTGQEIVGLVAAVGILVTAVIAYRKWPLDARKINVETVDVNVKIAGELRDDAVGEWKRVRAEMLALRAEFDQYREDTTSRLTEMSTELRAERAEKRAVKQENAVLRKRVDELEAEVDRLKRGRR